MSNEWYKGRLHVALDFYEPFVAVGLHMKGKYDYFKYRGKLPYLSIDKVLVSEKRKEIIKFAPLSTELKKCGIDFDVLCWSFLFIEGMNSRPTYDPSVYVRCFNEIREILKEYSNRNPNPNFMNDFIDGRINVLEVCCELFRGDGLVFDETNENPFYKISYNKIKQNFEFVKKVYYDFQ